MIKIDVRSDIAEVTKKLSRIQRQQLPYATAVALTKTAQAAQHETKRQMPIKLDRPRKFTVDSVVIEPAKKTKLESAVLFKPIAAQYLKSVLRGGTKSTRGIGIIVPYQAKRDRYGGIPARKRKAPLWRAGQGASRGEFVATIKGIHGVWKKTGNKISLQAVFEKKVQYGNVKFPFKKIVKGIVNAKFKNIFTQALANALRTAR